MDIAFVVSKLVVTEYTLIRQWWPDQLREARYLDTGLNRTYFLDKIPSPDLMKLMCELNEQGREYRFIDLQDTSLDLLEVNIDDASHNL